MVKSLKNSLNEKLPGLHTLFDNVYHEKPQMLIDQEKEFLEHIKKFEKDYDLSKFDGQFN